VIFLPVSHAALSILVNASVAIAAAVKVIGSAIGATSNYLLSL